MLRVVDVVVGLIRDVAPTVAAVRKKDPGLARQFRGALDSVLLNMAEGSGQRGARRTNHHAIALGSARESLAALRVAEAWGYVGALSPACHAGFRQVVGTLVNVVG